jgi:hypothetical protein
MDRDQIYKVVVNIDSILLSVSVDEYAGNLPQRFAWPIVYTPGKWITAYTGKIFVFNGLENAQRFVQRSLIHSCLPIGARYEIWHTDTEDVEELNFVLSVDWNAQMLREFWENPREYWHKHLYATGFSPAGTCAARRIRLLELVAYLEKKDEYQWVGIIKK